ncbi:MAG: hypothetical protein PHF76_12085 [Bacteroidales bacterium]|nr:hypothetical protein [Bacteroidales bacterium]
MVDLEKISTVERKKNVYVIKPEEFIEGKWLDDIKRIKAEGNYFEIIYVKGCLTIVTYVFKNKTKNE